LKKGNWLWTELLETETIYYCKLFFFSEQRLKSFLENHTANKTTLNKISTPYFIIANDSYIISYMNSLSSISEAPSAFRENLLSVKFDELILYLLQKYGSPFEQYLHSLIVKDNSSL